MSNSLTQETTDVYVKRLQLGLGVASLRLQRLERELAELTASFGASASYTLMAELRRDRQLVLIDALSARLTALGGS
ncbi:hypothetical protein [Paraliomyxa miuraensis]|uniref:hypothetical protein n=1 Tax=Paraliomyxa miuraensis TaxID=376150 RepID=UPI002259EB5A|nr:hypothetical protein [Paraliomyxa miuraensis]MCX4247454.1 hypothetical protein [Paraliomyxa miuraensis]